MKKYSGNFLAALRANTIFFRITTAYCIALQVGFFSAQAGAAPAVTPIRPSKSSQATAAPRISSQPRAGASGLTPVAEKKFEAALGVSVQDFLNQLKTAGQIQETRVRKTVKDAAKSDKRYQSAASKSAPSPTSGYSLGAGMSRSVIIPARKPGSSSPGASMSFPAHAASATSPGSAMLGGIPHAAVVLSKNGAEDLSELIVPRFAGLALETYIKENNLDSGMDPIFPDEQENSVQSTTYTRTGSAPAPGTFKIQQQKTDLAADRFDFDWWKFDLWLSYNVNMENFEVKLPISSGTFDLSFSDPDLIRSSLDLGNDISVKFGAKFDMSSHLKTIVIAGGALLTALAAFLSPLLAALLGGLTVIAATLEGNWYYSTSTLSDTSIKSLVLKIETDNNSPLLVRDIQTLDLDLGSISLVGENFQKILDAVAKLFNGRIADSLGLDGTHVESCTGVSDCVSDIIEIYFMRGSLTAGREEDCWKTTGGEITFKTNPKSPKCTLVSAMNSALTTAGSISLEEAGRSITVTRKDADVVAQSLQMQFDLALASSLPTGSCVAKLPEYQPQRYHAGTGGTSYSLTPKGDLDLFLPVNTIEQALHLVVREGTYCPLTSSSTLDPVTGTQIQYSVVPAGQFELQSNLSVLRPGITRMPGALGLGKGGSSGAGSTSASAATLGRLKYLTFKAPLAASMEISKTLSAGGLSSSAEIEANMSGTLEGKFLLEMSCSTTNGITLRPISGTITGLTGTVTDTLSGSTTTCADASCAYFNTMDTAFKNAWNNALLALPVINLPSLTAYTDAGLYLSLDGDNTTILDGKALRLPLEVSSSNPCSTGTSGGGGGGGGGGGTLPGPGGNLPGIDINPWDRDGDEDRDDSDIDSPGVDAAEMQGVGL